MVYISMVRTETEFGQAENTYNPILSRRSLLKNVIGAAILISRPHLLDIPQEKRDFDLKIFDNIDIGASFSPEEFGLNQANYKSEEGQRTQNAALNMLRFIQEDLGINDVRLGVRWTNIVDENGNFDFGMYKPFFDYCLKNGMNVTLNVGIKVFRWPEEHIPTRIIENMPKAGSVISSTDEIAKTYLIWGEKLFNFLRSNYSKEELEQIKTIQPENESYNSFGKLKLTMSDDYLVELTALARNYFQESDILLTSSEFFNLGQIYNLFEILSSFVDKNKLKIGINDYPFLAGNLTDPIEDYNLKTAILGGITIRDFKKQGYQIEVSEAEAEPWLDEPMPDPLSAFKIVTLRATDNIFNPKQKSVLRLWGIKYVYNQAPEISKPLFDLLRTIKKSKEKS